MEKIILLFMPKSFFIDEAKNVGIAKAITRLFNKVYRKIAKAEMQIYF